ncbi:MAG TPA: DUF3224 domain-containing protein [Micromonosporaceae bacterium]
MNMTVQTKLEIKSWDEQPYRELPDGRKFATARVTLAGTSDDFASGEFEALLYYRPDGTSTYVTIMHVTGALSGRTGSFVLRGDGEYDGTTARAEYRVVPGSGTDGLAGIRGTGQSVSTHADYPYMPVTLTIDLG